MYFFYYYPIGVDVPRPRVPWLSWGLAASLVAIFACQYFEVIPSHVWTAYVYRPVDDSLTKPLTAIFLHGSWLHLAGNLVYLLVFAPALERALRRVGFLLLYCGTGYLGNLIQGAYTVHFNPDAAWGGVVGASGAISGILGLFLVRFYFARIRVAYWAFLPLQGINKTGRVHLPAFVGVAMWLLLQLVYALVQGNGGGTAYAAHLGGLGTGVFLAMVLGQLRHARLDRLRAKAELAREGGNLHDATACLDSYVQQVPWDREAWLELARTLSANREWGRAQSVYAEIVRKHMDEDDLVGAAGIFLEARRGNTAFALPSDQMRAIAFWLEKSTRFAESVATYLDFARVYPDDPHREHAMARAATLMSSRLGDRDGALGVLDEALADFPEGAWAPLLQRERQRLSLAGRA